MIQLTDDITEALTKFRQDAVDLKSFQQWVNANHGELATVVSPGVLLKLRRGNTQKVMAAIASILLPCDQCGRIAPPADFSSRLEHVNVAADVDSALRTGTLKRISRPTWLSGNSQHLGADAYFRCVHCGSIWSLVEPEQHDNGSWQRLA